MLSRVQWDWEPTMTVLTRTIRYWPDRSTRFRAIVWKLILPKSKHSATHLTVRNDELMYNIIRRMNGMWINNWLEGWPWINKWNEGRCQASSMFDGSFVTRYIVLKTATKTWNNVTWKKTTYQLICLHHTSICYAFMALYIFLFFFLVSVVSFTLLHLLFTIKGTNKRAS